MDSRLLAVVVAIAMSVWRSRQARKVTTYGSARWADAADIRKTGLTKPAGVFLGQHDDQYLRHEGPEHVLTFAPTRSGKGVGLVVPTLLSWPASAVIHDIKGENWQITAGWRVSRRASCRRCSSSARRATWGQPSSIRSSRSPPPMPRPATTPAMRYARKKKQRQLHRCSSALVPRRLRPWRSRRSLLHRASPPMPLSIHWLLARPRRRPSLLIRRPCRTGKTKKKRS